MPTSHGEQNVGNSQLETVRKACAQRLAASTKSSQSFFEQFEKAIQCSTPCGVDEIFTQDPGRAYGTRALLCSTPCGVDEIFTWPAAAKAMRDTVLNALRRRRNLHAPSGGTRPFFKRVLNALRRRRNLHDGAGSDNVIESIGAQRLAASTKSSPGYGCDGPGKMASAQRLAASTKSSLMAVMTSRAVLLCSTPCGVDEIFTKRPPKRHPSERVLNALRRRRNLHRIGKN